jgi:hypothetical protein
VQATLLSADAQVKAQELLAKAYELKAKYLAAASPASSPAAAVVGKV